MCSLAHDLQYRKVNGGLARAKTAVDRNGPAEVGCVIGVLRAEIKEEYVSVVAALVVGIVVQDTAVDTAGHDGGISVAGGAVAQKFVGDFRFDFVFHDAGPHKAQYALEGQSRDVDGLLDEGHFQFRFDHAESAEQGLGAVVPV